MRRLLQKRKLRCVIETGARFLLDPRRKHQPTLLSPDRGERSVRSDFLEGCVKLAAHLNADAVSFWSGTAVDDAPAEVLWQRLADGCHSLIDNALEFGVRLAFEPEPGMFIDTMEQFEQLLSRLGEKDSAPPRFSQIASPAFGIFGLTLDIGHLHCLGETPIAEQILRWKDVLWNVHLDDMRRGVHDHLMFGEGEIDFGPVLGALKKIDYAGGAYVELSRHSHDAVGVAERSLRFLRQMASPSASVGGTP